MNKQKSKSVIIVFLILLFSIGIFTIPALAAPTAQIACTAPPWQPGEIYVGNDLVTHNGHQWRAKWWTTNEEPGTTGQWGVWEDQGACDGTTTPTPTNTVDPTVEPTVTNTPQPTITATPGEGCTDPQYVPGTNYVAGDTVQNIGNRYVCVITGWCGSTAAWAYEPGVGSDWDSAWDYLGVCDGSVTPTATVDPTVDPTVTTTPTVDPTVTATPTVDPTITATPTVVPPGDYEVVAYYTQWGIYGRNYHVKDIVTSGSADDITIINYAFGHIVNNECIMRTQTGMMDAYADYQKSYSAAQSVDGVGDTWDQALRGNFNQLRKLKEMYPHIKVLISLGGWTWSEDFSDAALTPQSRAQTAASCIDLYLRGNLPVGDGAGGQGAAAGLFDGIDIDWEYPGMPGHEHNTYRPEDVDNFPLFLQEFRTQMDALEVELGREFMLTIAPGAGVDKYSILDWSQIHPHLDLINLMTYDMHGAWENVTNMHAPVYPSPNDPSSYPANYYSIDSAVQDYLAAGVPASKLVLGLPFYGRGWKGVPDGGTNGLYQPATGGAPGTYEAGIEDYKVLKNLNYPLYRDPITQVPYLYNGDIFWSFEDPTSLANKIDYLKANGLRGAMVWSLDGDDASGTLMNTVGSELNP